MSAENTRADRIVAREILKGLPGEGPVPKHFHLDHPTPWKEGVGVRFVNRDGSSWIGNFQGGGSGHTEVIPWSEADCIAVIATDNFYLVEADNPDSYQTLGPQSLASGALLDEERLTLFVAEH